MKNLNFKKFFNTIFKLLIFTFLMWVFRGLLLNVNAEVVNINLSDLKFNNVNLLNLTYYNISEGNRTLYFDYDFNSINESATILYNSVVLCSDAKYTSAYASDPSEVSNISINNSNYNCSYSNSSYSLGKVVIINFVTFSSGSNSIVVYQNSNASVQLIDFVVDSSGYVNSMNYSSQSLINQNSQIINQNNTIINNQSDIKNSITDESSPNLSVLQNSAGWLKPGPVDSIINLPLSFLNNLQVNLGKSCTPVVLPLPFVEKDLLLPCLTSIYSQIEGLNSWINVIGVIAAAFILYRYFMYLYNYIDNTLSFRENNLQGYFDDSIWGGM